MSDELKSRALSAAGRVTETQGLRTGLSVDDIAHPAYMIDYNFDLAWYNEAARLRVLGFELPPPPIGSRNVFLMLSRSLRHSAAGRRELLRLYVTLAKARLSKRVLLETSACLGLEARASIETFYDKAVASCRKMVLDTHCTLEDADGANEAWQVYGVYFREGVLVIHVPEGQVDSNVLEFISRRDIVVRNLMRKQLPTFTAHAVLTASLEGSACIRAQLPVARYFELIQDVWASMTPVLRRHRGTCGKHLGDGIQYRFLPQPDADFLANAQACAAEMKQAMREVSSRWQLELPGLPELTLCTAVEKREGWVGDASNAASLPTRAVWNRTSEPDRPLHLQTLHDIKTLGATLMAKQRPRSMPSTDRLFESRPGNPGLRAR